MHTSDRISSCPAEQNVKFGNCVNELLFSSLQSIRWMDDKPTACKVQSRGTVAAGWSAHRTRQQEALSADCCISTCTIESRSQISSQVLQACQCIKHTRCELACKHLTSALLVSPSSTLAGSDVSWLLSKYQKYLCSTQDQRRREMGCALKCCSLVSPSKHTGQQLIVEEIPAQTD